MGGDHNQQGGIVDLLVVAGQIVQAGNLADARRAADGKALRLVQFAGHHHCCILLERHHPGIDAAVEHGIAIDEGSFEAVDLHVDGQSDIAVTQHLGGCLQGQAQILILHLRDRRRAAVQRRKQGRERARGPRGIQAGNAGGARQQAGIGRGLNGITLAHAHGSCFAVAQAQLNLIQFARVRRVQVEVGRGLARRESRLRQTAAKQRNPVGEKGTADLSGGQ